jgi:hypothetical protein
MKLLTVAFTLHIGAAQALMTMATQQAHMALVA